jgi:hypothetical protein
MPEAANPGRRGFGGSRVHHARVDGGVCGVRCRLLAPDVDRLDRVATPARNGVRPVDQQPQSICRQGMNRRGQQVAETHLVDHGEVVAQSARTNVRPHRQVSGPPVQGLRGPQLIAVVQIARVRLADRERFGELVVTNASPAANERRQLGGSRAEAHESGTADHHRWSTLILNTSCRQSGLSGGDTSGPQGLPCRMRTTTGIRPPADADATRTRCAERPLRSLVSCHPRLGEALECTVVQCLIEPLVGLDSE